jgi:hypothetical protein
MPGVDCLEVRLFIAPCLTTFREGAPDELNRTGLFCR